MCASISLLLYIVLFPAGPTPVTQQPRRKTRTKRGTSPAAPPQIATAWWSRRELIPPRTRSRGRRATRDPASCRMKWVGTAPWARTQTPSLPPSACPPLARPSAKAAAQSSWTVKAGQCNLTQHKYNCSMWFWGRNLHFNIDFFTQ